MKKTFKYFDLENKGVIGIKQFTQALEHFGCVFTKYEIEALFRKYDKDNSGKLVYDEFSNLFAYMGAGTNPNVNPVFTLTRIPPKDVLKNNFEDLQKRGVHGLQDLAVALRYHIFNNFLKWINLRISLNLGKLTKTRLVK